MSSVEVFARYRKYDGCEWEPVLMDKNTVQIYCPLCGEPTTFPITVTRVSVISLWKLLVVFDNVTVTHTCAGKPSPIQDRRA